MKCVFADTFYFLSLLNPSDETHAKVVAFTASMAFRMVTTECVLMKLADGMARSERGRAEFISTLRDLRADPDVTIVPFDRDLMDEAVRLYGDRPDKKWSLTDCVSFIIMKRQDITDALTGDHHFDQAGFVAIFK